MSSNFNGYHSEPPNNEGEEEEEEDYMSDAFLQQTADNKTSLLFSHKEQYQHKLFKKKVQTQQKSKKDLAQIEVERRNEALDKPITSGNKGFELLQKMMAKSTTNSKDITVLMEERKPIQIDFKTDRKGFGHEKPVTVKRKDFNDPPVISEQDFLKNKRSKSDLFYTKKDFYSCQRSCSSLDHEKELTEPLQPWFWPPQHSAKPERDAENDDDKSDAEKEQKEIVEEEDDDKEEEEEEIDYHERLQTLVDYLRQEYFYCNWCGVRYDSDQDLKQNCPGNNREDHID